MAEPADRPSPGHRLGAPESFGVSTLEPAPRPPPAAPPSGRQAAIRVQMLDDTQEVFDVSSRSLGKALFDLVCAHINLAEGDYFGLEYQDHRKMTVWLDLLKPTLKQIRRPKNTILRFVVKFFPPDHTQLLEELTRYLFALQIKRDLACGHLTCNDSSAALLISHIVQSEVGDFDEVQSWQHLLHNKYMPDQDALRDQITENHRKHVGQTPAESDYQLLEIARRLEMYGVRLHPAKDREGTKLSLAVAHTGVLVLQGHTKINAFNWSKIRKLSFKRKRFLIKLRPDLNQSAHHDTLEFVMATRDCCKIFWKICVEYHAFFRLFEEPKPKPKPVLFTRGSSFRFSGRTQKQIIDYVKDSEFKKVPFERKHSKIQSSFTPQCSQSRSHVPKESAVSVSLDQTDSRPSLRAAAPSTNGAPDPPPGSAHNPAPNGLPDPAPPQAPPQEEEKLQPSPAPPRTRHQQNPGPASRGSSSSIPYIDCSDIDSELDAAAAVARRGGQGGRQGLRARSRVVNDDSNEDERSVGRPSPRRPQPQQQGIVGSRNRLWESSKSSLSGGEATTGVDELFGGGGGGGGGVLPLGRPALHSTLLDEIFHGGAGRTVGGTRSSGSSPVVGVAGFRRTGSLSHGEQNGDEKRPSHWDDGGHYFSKRPGGGGVGVGGVASFNAGSHHYGSYSPVAGGDRRSPRLAKLRHGNRSDTDPFILSQLMTSTPRGHDPPRVTTPAVSSSERRAAAAVALSAATNGNGLAVPGQARSNTVQRLYGGRRQSANQNAAATPVQMIDGSTSSGTDSSDSESDAIADGNDDSLDRPLVYGNPAAVGSSPLGRSQFSFDSLQLEEGEGAGLEEEEEAGFNFDQEDVGARVFSC